MGGAVGCGGGGVAGAAAVAIAAEVLAAVLEGGVGGCGVAGLSSVDGAAAGVSLTGLGFPGGRDESTASKATTAAIMMPGKKYRMSVPQWWRANHRCCYVRKASANHH